MPASSDRILGLARPQLYILGGICFAIAGITQYFENQDQLKKWVTVLAFLSVSILYLVLAWNYAKKKSSIAEARSDRNE